MPKKSTVTRSYSLLEDFSIQGYSYSSKNNLKLWIDFDETINDRSVYSSTISSIGFEGSVPTSTATIGRKTYNVARFDDSENLNALVTYNSTTNVISFGNGTTDSAFTISFWHYRDSAYANTSGTFFEKGAFLGTTKEYKGYYNGTNIYFELTDSVAAPNATNGTQALNVLHPNYISDISDLDDTWYHYTFTYDGRGGVNAHDGMEIYVNGELVTNIGNRSGSGTGYVAMDPVSDDLYVGANLVGSSELDGYMAEFAIIGARLTSDEIKSIYLGTQDNVSIDINNSGFLNNPARTIIKDLDNRTGTYPTVHRMNRKDSTGILSNIVFDDTRTIKFGNAIKDNFTIEEANVFSRQVDSSLWEVSTTDVLVKKEFDPASDLELTTGAVVLGGAGDSDGRWLKTKNKIANPTLIFSVLQGPYNNTGALANFKLNLGQGQITDTFKIQASVDGSNWDYDIDITANNLGTTYGNYINLDSGVLQPTPIFTFFNGLTGEQQNTSGQQKKAVLNIKLDIQDFSKAGLKEPFYLRFIQPSISDNNVAVWAIGHVNIVSREDQVTYPHLGQRDPASEYFLSQSIATPNFINSLVASGSSVRGITDAESIGTLPFNDQTITPFSEESVIDFRNDGFYTVGTKEDIVPGFGSGLLSKTKFEIDLSPTSDIDLGLTKDFIGFDPTSALDDSGDGPILMAYWNNSSKLWEKIGQPLGVSLNNKPGTTDYISTLKTYLTSSAIGFGPQLQAFASSSDGSATTNNGINLFSKDALSIIGKPTDLFAFPYGPQYHATSSQYIKAKDLGITKPFLFEKSSLNLDIKIEQAADNYAFNEWVMRTNDGPSAIVQLLHMSNILPTFFILRQRKDNFDKNYSIELRGNGLSPVDVDETYNFSIPGNFAIVSGSNNLTWIDTSRELITYKQPLITFKFNNFDVNNSFNPANLLEEGYPGDRHYFYDENSNVSALGGSQVDTNVVMLTASLDIDSEVKIASNYPGVGRIKVQGGINTNELYQYRLLTKKVSTDRSRGEMSSQRGLISNTTSFAPGTQYIQPNVADGDSPLDVTSPSSETINNTSPFIILPEDDLIFGWQYPIPRDPVLFLGPRANPYYGHNKMTLFGSSKLTLYGSQIKDGKEFHEGLNQNLTSNVVHEVIGSGPVIDQWQIETRGELTGSISDQFMWGLGYKKGEWQAYVDRGYSLPIPSLKYVYGRLITPINSTINVNTGYSYDGTTAQERWFWGVNPVNRLDFETVVGGNIFTKNVQSLINPDSVVVTQENSEPGFKKDYPNSKFLPQIQRFNNCVDRVRVYSDSEIDNLSFSAVSTVDPRRLIYGSGQNYTMVYGGADKVKLGGSPKYYFNLKHYGYFSDIIRQGLDSKFERIIERGNRNISEALAARNITESAVRVRFVEDDYDEENLNFRKFSLIKAGDVDGTSQESFQSSNLSLFATSSLPFFDDNIVRNRTYGTETVEVV